MLYDIIDMIFCTISWVGWGFFLTYMSSHMYQKSELELNLRSSTYLQDHIDYHTKMLNFYTKTYDNLQLSLDKKKSN